MRIGAGTRLRAASLSPDTARRTTPHERCWRKVLAARAGAQANAPPNSAAVQDAWSVNAAPRNRFRPAVVSSPGKEPRWERELLSDADTWWPFMSEKHVGLRALAQRLVSTGQSLRTSLRWSHSTRLPTEYTCVQCGRTKPADRDWRWCGLHGYVCDECVDPCPQKRPAP